MGSMNKGSTWLIIIAVILIIIAIIIALSGRGFTTGVWWLGGIGLLLLIIGIIWAIVEGSNSKKEVIYPAAGPAYSQPEVVYAASPQYAENVSYAPAAYDNANFRRRKH